MSRARRALLHGAHREGRAQQYSHRPCLSQMLATDVATGTSPLRACHRTAATRWSEGTAEGVRTVPRGLRLLMDCQRHRPDIHLRRYGTPPTGDCPPTEGRGCLRPAARTAPAAVLPAHRRHLSPQRCRLWRLLPPVGGEWFPLQRPALPRRHAGRTGGVVHHRRPQPNLFPHRSTLTTHRYLRCRRHHPRRWSHCRPQRLRHTGSG